MYLIGNTTTPVMPEYARKSFILMGAKIQKELPATFRKIEKELIVEFLMTFVETFSKQNSFNHKQ